MAGRRLVHVTIESHDTKLLERNPYVTIKINVGDDDNHITWTERVHHDHADDVPGRVLGILNAAFDKLGPSAADPRAREIADALAADINAGRYQPGRFIPTKRNLVARFQASPRNILAALRLLRAAGIIDTKPGVGSWVHDDYQPPTGTN